MRLLILFFFSACIKAQDLKKPLCIFDYDLTLSAHQCPGIADDTEVCETYGWRLEGMSTHARTAITRCIEEGANVGILSASPALCLSQKITHLVKEVPEILSLTPDIKDFSNWNLDPGPFWMSNLTQDQKPKYIDQIMKFYNLTPGEDDKFIIFFDDDSKNIEDMSKLRPQINSVKIDRNINSSEVSGCGVSLENIEEGFSKLNTALGKIKKQE
jgi:hypothetical protein